MNEVETIIETAAARVGWQMDTMLELMCEYINNQGDNATFRDFIDQREADELAQGAKL